MYLKKLNASRPVNKKALYQRMKLAIERIEAQYSPALQFDGYFDIRRQELDKMDIHSFATIEAWESGWLQLISEIRAGQSRPKAVGRKLNGGAMKHNTR